MSLLPLNISSAIERKRLCGRWRRSLLAISRQHVGNNKLIFIYLWSLTCVHGPWPEMDQSWNVIGYQMQRSQHTMTSTICFSSNLTVELNETRCTYILRQRYSNSIFIVPLGKKIESWRTTIKDQIKINRRARSPVTIIVRS